MKLGLFERVRRAFNRQPELHPIDRKMAKRWIKQRLVVVFPELRNNPHALEAAYRSLNLEAKPGQEEGDADTVFEMTFPNDR